MKKLVSLLLIIAMIAFALVGCAGNSQTPAGTQTEDKQAAEGSKASETQKESENGEAVIEDTKKKLGDDEKVHMTLAIWGNENHQAIYEKIFQNYAKEHPNFSGEVMLIPFAEYSQKITIMIAGNEIPDVVWLSDRMIPQFMASGKLVNLASLKDDPEYDFNDINPGSFSLMTKDGDPYGIAFSNPPQIIFYNKTLFEKKGVTTPQELYKAGNWNMETFLDCAKKLTDKAEGTYGFQISDSSGWMDNTYWFIAKHGATLFPEGGGSFGYATPEGKEGLQFYMDMIFKHGVTPMPGDQITFDAGKIGMYKGPVSGAKNLSKADFEFDIAPLPEGKVKYCEAGFAGYFILDDGNKERTEQRIEFLKLLSNKENMFLTSEMFVPSRASIVSSQEYIDFLPIKNKEAVKNTIIDQLPDMTVLPGHVNWAKIDAATRVIFDKLYTQEYTVDDACKAFDEEVTPLLSE
jgi:multiple sugar transport system substrate-binding protein